MKDFSYGANEFVKGRNKWEREMWEEYLQIVREIRKIHKRLTADDIDELQRRTEELLNKYKIKAYYKKERKES